MGVFSIVGVTENIHFKACELRGNTTTKLNDERINLYNSWKTTQSIIEICQRPNRRICT